MSYERSIVGRAPAVSKRLPQDVLRSGKENNWQSITKECQRFLTRKQAKKKKNTTKATKQWKQDDSHAEYYTHRLMRRKSSVSNPRIEYKSEFSNLV